MAAEIIRREGGIWSGIRRQCGQGPRICHGPPSRNKAKENTEKLAMMAV